MGKTDKEIEKIEQGDAWQDTDTIVELKIKKPLDKVIPIRLQAQHWEKLRELAGEMGVGPTTLARMWILERLSSIGKKDTLLNEAIDQFLLKHSFVPILTPREFEVFKLIGQGYTNKQIADTLGTSVEVIQNQMIEILRKIKQNRITPITDQDEKPTRVSDNKGEYSN